MYQWLYPFFLFFMIWGIIDWIKPKKSEPKPTAADIARAMLSQRHPDRVLTVYHTDKKGGIAQLLHADGTPVHPQTLRAKKCVDASTTPVSNAPPSGSPRAGATYVHDA